MLLNIKFSDGNKLISYDDDTRFYDGCPTCDYGSEYINEITVRTTNHTFEAKFNQMYEYAMTTADAIKIFAVGIAEMTEINFIEYLKQKFYEVYNKNCNLYNSPELKMYLDGKEVA